MIDDDEDETVTDADHHMDSRPSTLLKEKWIKAIFQQSKILTVWRPTSKDAMRKMMEGAGVGKGLDIKGKSAKKGKLSAYVPLMQIHENEDKKHVQPIPRDARMRVYFSNEQARDSVVDNLKQYTTDEEDGNDHSVDPGDEKAEQTAGLSLDKQMMLLDQFAPKRFGIELTQKIFWEGYVTHQDIARGPDTETGRMSTPGFQDANMKTLRVACAQDPRPDPMPVVLQMDDDNPMSPQTLCMAYEENSLVQPVVSDFDGFLLGWKREALWFGCNLPRQQEDLMMWCIENIEKILEGPLSPETWTIRWLNVLREATRDGLHFEIPEYGFGDPKSYSIMEKAALRMVDTGAVRHGSECFNYYFPQEIDDTFLLVSDTLSPVPWKYVNVQELQEILSQKIQEGFVFPLNPKWILCDPGWKKLYDELMASDALYADLSKDVWYPPGSGVREKIENIYKKYPDGFQRRQGQVKFDPNRGFSPQRRNLGMGMKLNTGHAAFDLAELEMYEWQHERSQRKYGTSQKLQLAQLIRDANLEDEYNTSDDEDFDEKDDKDDKSRDEGEINLTELEAIADGSSSFPENPEYQRRLRFSRRKAEQAMSNFSPSKSERIVRHDSGLRRVIFQSEGHLNEFVDI